MSIDPFATANTDTPTTDSQKENTTVTNTNSSDKSEISTTIKHGAGYDAPWTVVRTPDAATAIEIMDDPDFKKLMDLTGKIAAQVQPEKPAAAAPARSGGYGKPAGAAAAPNGETPPEGYVFKTGVSKKTGKPWKAFMPIDRNSGLEVIWLRD